MAKAGRTIQETKEWAEKEVENRRIRQLTSLRIHHQKSIDEIDKELDEILKVEVGYIGH